MNPEKANWHEPFDRGGDPSFVDAIREGFAALLEDRATDSERGSQGASATLFALGEAVREGKKLPRTPSALEIFRGVFYAPDGAMYKYRLSQTEVDFLEKNFFEASN